LNISLWWRSHFIWPSYSRYCFALRIFWALWVFFRPIRSTVICDHSSIFKKVAMIYRPTSIAWFRHIVTRKQVLDW
jgi:hypothetical protein